MKPTADAGKAHKGNEKFMDGSTYKETRSKLDLDFDLGYKESPESAAERLHKHSIQNLMQIGQPSDSTLQWLYRNIYG